MIGSNSISGEALRSLIERVERLEEEKRGLSDDIKDVFAEAKAQGFDVKTMRELIRLRKMNVAYLNESRALLEIYAHAIGMQLDLGL